MFYILDVLGAVKEQAEPSHAAAQTADYLCLWFPQWKLTAFVPQVLREADTTFGQIDCCYGNS